MVGGSHLIRSRFEAFHSAETPLVGREEELEPLMRRLAQAKAGEGRVVLLAAEPGIGKSRLVTALEHRLHGEPCTSLRYFCSSHYQDSALHPIISQIERAAEFDRGDLLDARRTKLQTLLTAASTSSEDMVLFAELLSLPKAGTSVLDHNPQLKKEKIFEALLRQIESLSRKQPVLMIFEDIHWIDPTSRELLDLGIDRLANSPVLLIMTFRSGFQVPWEGLPHVTTLVLSRLGNRESEAIVRQLTANTSLPRDLLQEIVERADGVPLFLEEVTKAVLESGDGADQVLSKVPGRRLTVPSTLQASLMARLDRLGTVAKEIAQIGATIGREFSYELLAAVAQRTEAQLREGVERLLEAGLVFRRGAPPRADFLFKHALVQDAAYGTLLRDRRRSLHAFDS